MSNESAQFYAPKPQAASSYLYPPGSNPGLKTAPFRPPTGSPSLPVNKNENRIGVDYREVARTPSPTPSETEALAGRTRTINLKKYLDPKFWKSRSNIISFVVTIVILALVITFVALQDKIVDALAPAAKWLRETPFAWLIPIAIMIILSFPPLIGHELVALLCGDVWGVGIGFAIVAAGTIIGELCTYYTFRYCCRGRAEKAADKSLQYALLSAVIEEGGLMMAIMVRFSAIPGHITTAIFATAGMGVVTFLIAAIVALPKQLATVYLGSAGHSGAPVDENGDRTVSKMTTIIKVVVIVVTTVMTMAAMRYINAQIDNIKGRVIYERRKKRQTKLHGFSSASSSGLMSGSKSQSTLEDLEGNPSTPLVAYSGRG